MPITAQVSAVNFDSQGRYLITGCESGTVTLWGLDDFRESKQTLELEASEPVTAIAVSPDGNWLAASQLEGIRVWNLLNRSIHATLPVQRASVLLFDRNSRWLVTCRQYLESQSEPLLWKLTAEGLRGDPTRLRGADVAYEGHNRTHDCVMDSTGRWLLFGGENISATRYDLAAPDPKTTAIHMVPDKKGEAVIRSLAIHPQGDRLVVGRWGKQRSAELWNVPTHEARKIAPKPLSLVNGEVKAVTISADGRWLAVGSVSGRVFLWNISADAPEPSASSSIVLKGHSNAIEFTRFTADGRWLISSDGEAIRLWPLDLDLLWSIAQKTAGRAVTIEERI